MFESRISKELETRLFTLTLALYRVTDFSPSTESIRKHLREKANEIFGEAIEYGYTESDPHAALAIIAKVDAIKGYLRIAESLKVVQPINLKVLEREYDLILSFFNQELRQGDDEKEERHHQISGMKRQNRRGDSPNALHEESIAEENWEVKEKSSDAKGALGSGLRGNYAKRESFPREEREQKNDNYPSLHMPLCLNDRKKRMLDYIQGMSQVKISDFYSFFKDISSKTIQRDLQDLVGKNILKKEGERRWTVYMVKDELHSNSQ